MWGLHYSMCNVETEQKYVIFKILHFSKTVKISLLKGQRRQMCGRTMKRLSYFIYSENCQL